MNPDTVTEFGYYQPSSLVRALLFWAHHAPHNKVNRAIIELLRPLAWRRLPVDAEMGRIRMRCYAKDNASERRFLLTPWQFEWVERNLLRQILPHDGVFLDIGANVGVYALWVATHLSSAGRIIALEPNPVAFARLRFNLDATRQGSTEWPHIDALPLGVNAHAEEVELYLDPRNLGGSSLYQRKAPAGGWGAANSIRICCQLLLAILDELGVCRVDALKIDIEGAEDLALIPFLRDAPAAMLPRYLFMENSERLWRDDLPSALNTRGYELCTRSRKNLIYRLTGKERSF